MSSFREDLVTYARSLASLDGIVSDRIYWLVLPEDVTYPSMTYMIVGEDIVTSHSGSTDIGFYSVQFDLYSESSADADALYLAVRTAFDGNVSGNLQYMSLSGTRDAYQHPDRLWQTTVSVFFTYHSE